MARHSHWHTIRLKKGVLDKKKGKIFTKHAHLIAVAARQGGDMNMNPGLRMAVENAREANMPRENIDRAIKKGTGELKDQAEVHEITYEGYGPGGVALLIDTITDNKNRSSQNIRTTLQKNGGTMGPQGSTSFLFETRGMIVVKKRANNDEDELEIIDAGAQDIEDTGDSYIVYTAPDKLGQVRDALKDKKFELSSVELTKVAKTVVEIASEEDAQKLEKLLDLLDEDDDITNVATNAG